MGIRTYKYYNHVMVGELPKLPNDTMQRNRTCVRTCMTKQMYANIHDMHIYKRVVKIKQKTKLQLSNKTDMYIKCTHKT